VTASRPRPERFRYLPPCRRPSWRRSLTNIAAQRRSIDALKAQLSSFDEQLAVLEQVLGPLAEWSGK
jgi:hypothetical protein